MRSWGTLVTTGLVAGFWMAVTWAQAPSQGSGHVARGAERAPVPASGQFAVVLDAAHGGDDSGAQLGGSTAEKTVTLALSVRLRSLLTARGFQVVTTRESNSNLDADARAQIANHAGAAACLSLHATQTGSGVHLFVSSLAPTQPVRFLAWKTAQSAYVTRSLKLASVVHSALEHSTLPGSAQSGDSSPDASSIPVILARTTLPGVDSMACPALAVEIAPLRAGGNKGNEGVGTGANGQVTMEVTDPRYQTQIVEALAAALLEWRTDWQSDAGLGAGIGGRLP